MLHYFAQSSPDLARSLHAVLAAIKASSAAVFEAPARAVSASLGGSRLRSCGPGTFLSFQHTSTGADMCTWAAGATTTGGSVMVTRTDNAGISVAWLRCPDGAALVDAQFYKDEQLAVLVSAPEGASRLEIVDCSQLTFRLLGDDEPLNTCVTGTFPGQRVLVVGVNAPSVKSISLPPNIGAVAPLAVSPTRGLACVMGGRSCIVDVENEDELDDD